MDFVIKNVNKSIAEVARQLGYSIIDANSSIEYNLVRRLAGNNYPRFHVYLKTRGNDYAFSLHLDQKAPIYQSKGVHAHNGEYFGPVVEGEAERLKEILADIDDRIG